MKSKKTKSKKSAKTTSKRAPKKSPKRVSEKSDSRPAHYRVLAETVSEILVALSKSKELYASLDELTDELTRAPKSILKAVLNDAGLTLVDNFKNKNTTWKASAVRRFEFKLND